MSFGRRDSQLEILPIFPGGAPDSGGSHDGPLVGGPEVVVGPPNARTASAAASAAPGRAAAGGPAAPTTVEGGAAAVGAAATGEATAHDVWLEGETLLCRCPDCGAPMSIRLWLLIADCWQCGASIELSEEQEREIQRLLAERATARRESTVPAPPQSQPQPGPTPREPARPAPRSAAAAPVASAAAPAAPSTRTPVARPASPVGAPGPSTPAPLGAAPRRPAAAPPVKPPAVKPPASPPTPARITARPVERNWLRDWLKQTPAWLVSLIIHLIMLIVMALWEMPEEESQVLMILSTTVSRERMEGELQTPVELRNDPAFDLPIPDNLDVKDKQVREALLAADQEARALQLDPDLPAPNLPDLERVKELAASDDPVRRSLAVRDPRLRVLVVKREGGTTLTEAAVARGLRWLAQQQQPDGRWSERGGQWENAETSLALLPFLGAGQTHMQGMYKDHVAKGLRWLMRRQRENGDLRGSEAQHPGLYAHGIGAIVLCDAFAMTGDETLREPAQQAVDFIVAAQSREGGWRYFPRQDSDLSVVGWQLMALQSGRMSGLTVPEETLELASQYLDKVAHEGGAVYSYQHHGGEGRPTPAMTAEGLLCRMYLGWRKDEPALARGVDILRQSHLPTKQERNIYYWYYGTQVFHHFGGQPWEEWNRRMRDLLVESQVSAGPQAGSWNPDGDRWGGAGGRIFITSLSICSLEVYYRHAPIYRQLDLNSP